MNATEMMRREFHRLAAEHKARMAEAAPLRAEYDALQPRIDALMEQQRDLAARFKPIEAAAGELSNQMAALSTALRGKTGILQEDGSVADPAPAAA